MNAGIVLVVKNVNAHTRRFFVCLFFGGADRRKADLGDQIRENGKFTMCAVCIYLVSVRLI